MLQATASGLSLQTPAGHFGGKHLALAEISLWPSLSSGWLGAVPPDALLVQRCYQAKRAGETRGEWALQSSQLCLHLLQSWLGLHIAWTQARRRPPAENQQLVCQVLGCRSIQSANQISLVAAWTFLGNLVLNTPIIIFFPDLICQPESSRLAEWLRLQQPIQHQTLRSLFSSSFPCTATRASWTHACGSTCTGQRCATLGWCGPTAEVMLVVSQIWESKTV